EKPLQSIRSNKWLIPNPPLLQKIALILGSSSVDCRSANLCDEVPANLPLFIKACFPIFTFKSQLFSNSTPEDSAVSSTHPDGDIAATKSPFRKYGGKII